MKKKLLLGLVSFPLFAVAQIGINTSTPKKQLHVNGSLQVTNELNVGGSASAAGNAGAAGQYLKSNGSGAAPTWENIAGVAPGSNGTVIAINGQLVIAQEMMIQMTADFADPGDGTANEIGNLNKEIIDNESRYTGNTTTNSFTVSANGVYQIIMNSQLATAVGSSPVIGIWDNTDNKWVARVNDVTTGTLQTYTLITSIDMLASHTYSFRVAATGAVTVKYQSAGGTGAGPITQVSLKRLK
jgi:hypothetical protein